jgi:hypothetical protein
MLMKNFQKNGTASPSFVSNLLTDLESKENVGEEIEMIKDAAGIVYAAGAESASSNSLKFSLGGPKSDMTVQTVSTLTSFILVMLLYPEVQMKAQKELDAVVGRDRLPEFSDRPSLPYINAILKEVIRSVSGNRLIHLSY